MVENFRTQQHGEKRHARGKRKREGQKRIHRESIGCLGSLKKVGGICEGEKASPGQRGSGRQTQGKVGQKSVSPKGGRKRMKKDFGEKKFEQSDPGGEF